MSLSANIIQLNMDSLFDGQTIEPARDEPRLKCQYDRVFQVVKDEKWHTLAEISHLTGDPEASISARLRDVRKKKLGGHRMECEFVQNGMHRYRVLLNPNYYL